MERNYTYYMKHPLYLPQNVKSNIFIKGHEGICDITTIATYELEKPYCFDKEPYF